MASLSDSRQSVRVAANRQYRDLSLTFLKHPGTNDVRPLKDIEAVKNSVKNLILTNFGERPFRPGIGSNVIYQLFEPGGPFTAHKTQIATCLSEYEPRVNGVTIDVFDDLDRNAYKIRLQYNVISLNQQVETSFFLRRLR